MRPRMLLARIMLALVSGIPRQWVFSLTGRPQVGIADLAGNVWEWSDEWYVSGGSYAEDPRSLSSAEMVRLKALDGDMHVGFRCVEDCAAS